MREKPLVKKEWKNETPFVSDLYGAPRSMEDSLYDNTVHELYK